MKPANKNKYCILFFILIFFCLQSYVFPDDAKTDERKVFIVAVETWPPFRIEDEKSRWGYAGIDIDLIKEISKLLKIDIEVRRYPWARCLENIKTGHCDIILGLAYTKEREEYIYYIKPSYHYVKPVFYVKKGKGAKIAKYEDLYQYNIGVSINSAYFEPFNSDSRIRRTEISTEAQLIKMLYLDRVDVIAGTDPNISYDILKAGYNNAFEKIKYEPELKTELYVGLSKKSALLNRKNEIESIIIKLLNDKTIDKILKKYR